MIEADSTLEPRAGQRWNLAIFPFVLPLFVLSSFSFLYRHILFSLRMNYCCCTFWKPAQHRQLPMLFPLVGADVPSFLSSRVSSPPLSLSPSTNTHYTLLLLWFCRLIVGGAGAVTAKTVVAPLDRIKILLQTGATEDGVRLRNRFPARRLTVCHGVLYSLVSSYCVTSHVLKVVLYSLVSSYCVTSHML